MKRNICLGIILALVLNFNAFALDSKVFDLRNKIFEKSGDLKAMLPDAKNPAILINMFYACILTVTQLDAYINMVGIFNTIKKENLTDTTVGIITDWLNGIKKSNDENIKTINGAFSSIDQPEKIHIDKLLSFYSELNKQLDLELSKIYTIKKSMKIKR